METNQNPSFASDFAEASSDKKATEGKQVPVPTMTSDEMLKEIYENTRKTKNYMKWSLYITIILVVLPLLAALFIFSLDSLS